MTTDTHTRLSLAGQVGEFVAAAGIDDVPAEVLERARYLVLDAVGLAFASTAYGFPAVARDALAAFGGGEHPVLGMSDRLTARDAAVLNGVLIHGMDFDDTHIPAVTHVSAAALPAALAAAVATGASTADLLLAYVLGVEVSARVGIGGAGGFHDVGFHPTAVAGAFGAATAAGKVTGLDAGQLAAAQGVVGSMSAGLLEFLEDGSWTKRLHPGWAAMSGLTAASFAKAGWSGPPAVYEGRFGLYATHLAGRETHPEAVGAGLGTTWELMRTAVKPYPICHFNHAFADAALTLREAHGIRPEDVVAVRAGIHPTPGRVVSQPEAAKWAPRDEYDAKFSLPFTVAASLVRGRFTLAELEDDALADAGIRALAQKVRVHDDPDSAFPAAYSGALEIKLSDGRVLAHREQVNRGHDQRPLTNAEIEEKFRGTIGRVAGDATTDRVRAAVLALGDDRPASDFAEACRAG
ncbi:2-methylcitrate dehydratase PrpD [Pseudonocardia sediminis]|uniref:2-methylcitrate dehydratase PrpD n=1 Tax=Pseudonocardia sediminis TaxID=1397368 RepID=A0A4Q7UTY9_PSEST|nr:MmgE/PrpD family protein [Pseudonocardia sediminis]RZT83459.1 2-methylcitrate dehydratase PrpD [Pseudonocardia sediminis]